MPTNISVTAERPVIEAIVKAATDDGVRHTQPIPAHAGSSSYRSPFGVGADDARTALELVSLSFATGVSALKFLEEVKKFLKNPIELRDAKAGGKPKRIGADTDISEIKSWLDEDE